MGPRNSHGKPNRYGPKGVYGHNTIWGEPNCFGKPNQYGPRTYKGPTKPHGCPRTPRSPISKQPRRRPLTQDVIDYHNNRIKQQVSTQGQRSSNNRVVVSRLGSISAGNNRISIGGYPVDLSGCDGSRPIQIVDLNGDNVVTYQQRGHLNFGSVSDELPSSSDSESDSDSSDVTQSSNGIGFHSLTQSTIRTTSIQLKLPDTTPEPYYEGEFECKICMAHKIKIRTVPCGHGYCIACTRTIFKDTVVCPNCRTNVTSLLKIY